MLVIFSEKNTIKNDLALNCLVENLFGDRITGPKDCIIFVNLHLLTSFKHSDYSCLVLLP